MTGQWAQLNVFVGRITHIDLFHLGDEGIDKGVMHLIGDNKAFCRNTGFPVVIEPTHNREFDRCFDVCILKHQIGVVGPELEHGLFQRLRGDRPDVTARAIAARHCHATHLGVFDELVAGVVVDQDHLEQVFG